ncbi:MAG TPA: sigma-70 family RNA polymerase sigma factor [Longimicrobiales bacterium]|nr:sigma-70 family RNA polymerase sigma factor [Longimicrobiales bacterium]
MDEKSLLRWQRELLRYVHRLTGDVDLAEDVAQEAILRLLRLREERELDNPRAWLFRVATNLVRDGARRAETAKRLTPTPETETHVTPESEWERHETIRRVRAALDRIPFRDRELLLMRESGFKYWEIADVIGVKPESVSTLARRALAKFEAAYRAEFRDEASH